MIALTLRFDESALPRMTGAEQGKFLLDMLKEHPGFALQAADEIEVRGDFGTVKERR